MNKKVFAALLILGVISVSFSILLYFDLISFNNFRFFKQSPNKNLSPRANQEETVVSTPSSFISEEITYPDYIRSPEPKAFVDDLAGFIPDEKEEEIYNLLKSYEDKTTNVICILTVKSLGPESIEDYTTRVFNEWHIGLHEEKNGILIVVTPGEVRIGIGSGFEDKLSNDLLEKILKENFLPYFQLNDISDGIIKVVNALIEYI